MFIRVKNFSYPPYSFIPTWTIGGNGWTDTAWGRWATGRNDGTNYTGIATMTLDSRGYKYLRFLPNSYGWNGNNTGGTIKIYINNTLVFNGTRAAGNALDIDISSYNKTNNTITVKVEVVSGSWGYASMYCDTTLWLHQGVIDYDSSSRYHHYYNIITKSTSGGDAILTVKYYSSDGTLISSADVHHANVKNTPYSIGNINVYYNQSAYKWNIKTRYSSSVIEYNNSVYSGANSLFSEWGYQTSINQTYYDRS